MRHRVGMVGTWCWRRLFVLLTPCVRSLRAKFILVIVLLQLVVMGLVTLVVEYQQRDMILQESQKRAVALVTYLAALSEGYLLSYNFIKLEQLVEQLAAEDDVAYAIVHLHDGRVAAFSHHPEQQGQWLDDAVSQPALLADQLLVQTVTTAAMRGRGYDVALPVFAPRGTRKWGTVRIGLSLARAAQAMRKTSTNLLLLGLLALLLGTGGAIFLAMWLSRPIQQLVTGVNAVAQGNYDYPIAVTVRDDIGDLARRFEEMRQALRLHMAHLAEEKWHLEHANKMLQDMQEQLIQREKLAAVGRLAAQVAHEVNNPLAIIKTSIRILNRQISSEHPSKDTLLAIEEEIERIARTIRQLLDFARPAPAITPVEVNEVIAKLMHLLDTDLAARRIAYELELAAELPRLCMSPDHLKQVLLNLIKNAQEAMPAGGMLHLQTARHPGGLRISVRDGGTGIPPEHLPRLFEPFFSTKRSGTSMGLGLAISANIVKSYGGTIEIVSQPGQGSVFHIYLPTEASGLHKVYLQEATDCDNKEQHPWRGEVF